MSVSSTGRLQTQTYLDSESGFRNDTTTRISRDASNSKDAKKSRSTSITREESNSRNANNTRDASYSREVSHKENMRN